MRPLPLALLLLAAWLLCLLSAPATAQGFREEITKAGLRLWEFSDDDADRFSLAVIVGTGSRDEEEEQAGISHFLEHVIFQSAAERPPEHSDPEVSRRGLATNGYTTSEVTVYHISGSAVHWPFMVEWLADHVLRPRFEVAEVENERRTVQQEIATEGPDFDALTFEAMLYGDHPLARSIGGSETTVASITVEDLRAVHKRFYHAANIAVGFAGRVPSTECFELLHKSFGGVAAGPPVGKEAPDLRTGNLRRETRVGTDRSSTLRLGYHLQCTNAPELPSLLVLSQYLDDRFFAVAREEQHLAYAPSVRLICYRDVQRLDFVCPTSDRANLRPLATIVEDLVGELRHPDPAAIAKAARTVNGRFHCSSATELADTMELAAWVAWHGGEVPALVASIAKMQAIDLSTAAERWLHQDSRFNLSEVQLLDTSGAPWALFVLLAIGLLYWFRARVLDVARATGSLLRPRPKPAGRVLSMKKGGPIKPVDADEIERSFQRYFEEEDRSRGDR